MIVGMRVWVYPSKDLFFWRCRMTQEFSIAYPVEGGPSKWDLMLALFDRENDVRSLKFIFGTKPLDMNGFEVNAWSLALRNPPKTYEPQVRVIGVETYLSKGDSYHIKAHVTVTRNLIVGCANNVGKHDHVTMLAEIYFTTDKRKGSVVFKMIPD